MNVVSVRMKLLPVHFGMPEIFYSDLMFWLTLDFSCKISRMHVNFWTVPYTTVHANISVAWLTPAL
jgi:hypothetical protein